MTTPRSALHRAAYAASAALVAGGLVAGFAPLPGFFFSCGSAFVGQGLGPDGAVDTDALLQCTELRAQRQGLALALLTVGAASGVGSAAARWSPTAPGPARAAEDLPPVDADDHVR
ncbi:hypothetical protein [Cellulomonas sp. ATA003]|uniref:hypothetical protein n=1 Tax=Cellulomonas sp. ATA003 TaxID=3073064 RepID=UPI0028734CEB|nr:hypothetical protein [Cellulomonas sp. ATA003]WNB86130.1 hypothetical protein REH70_02285 [Cellulomonas sp. ATA003]